MFARALSTPLRKASVAFAATTTVGLGYIASNTTLVKQLPKNDPIYSHPAYQRLNPHRNDAHNDVVIKEIPLDRIRPELLEKEEQLTLELCRGVWSSTLGFDLGRLYYYLRHYSPTTSSQLWSRNELSTSNYEPGTELTNHFNVLSHTPSEIVLRFSDAPSVTGLRPLDGLFSISTQIDREAGVARLRFKTLIYRGDEKMEGKPAPKPVEVVHWWVSRFWMVLASQRLLK